MKTSIEWTESTWNPTTGCTKISPGCTHCYAERMALRLEAMGNQKYANGFRLTVHHDTLNAPLGWRKPQLIFVNSMSDLFHRDVPLTFIQAVFGVMAQASWHRFQILTKRSERLMRVGPKSNGPTTGGWESAWRATSIASGSTTCGAPARGLGSFHWSRCSARCQI